MEQLVTQLKAFNPTKIAVYVDERDDAEINASYQGYLEGTYELTRSLHDQIGFRLAKQMGHPKLYCVADWPKHRPIRDKIDDHLMDYATFAEMHNQEHLLWSISSSGVKVRADVDGTVWVEHEGYEPLIDMYIRINDPEQMSADHQSYLRTARIGLKDQIPGWHFTSSGMDAINERTDDVLASKRQREIEQLVEQLKEFKPTKIAVEVDPSRCDTENKNYQGYLNGTYALGPYEGDQIGYRTLAYHIDHELIDTDTFAKAHNQEHLLQPLPPGKITRDKDGKIWIEPEKYEPMIDKYIRINRPENTDALSDVNVHIRPGEILAIVGENGAGKTTLAHILAGLRSPTAGRVTIDGIDTATISSEDLRRACTVVFQHPARYPTTLHENLALDSTDASDSHVAATLTQVGLSTEQYPLNTFLGPEFGGADFSGGEWQRVAIARSLIKEAGEFVIFDEPTAALDPLAELEIFQQFVELVDGKTALLIAHRLGPTRLADRVVVLDNGRIVEIGDPTELLQQNGKYAEMFAAQSEWYQ
ncbi:Nisin transport ATP-binding protein NisT [Geodia barretti]|uniref:Nisin transport ATP-binding protein NisT n=1 Tax=Geodia barretti TaxID=519541 RepID=A0AA35WYQ0_GEOBA|nr:Nisin transport ATP-binding protein NisT [Geodia barretti]